MERTPEFHRENRNERGKIERLSEALETLSYYNDLVHKLKRTGAPLDGLVETIEREEEGYREYSLETEGNSENGSEFSFELTREEDILRGRGRMEREVSRYGFSLLSRTDEEQEAYPELFLEVYDEESVKETLRTLLRTTVKEGATGEHARYVLGDLIATLRRTFLEPSIPPEEKFPIFLLISKELPKLAQEYGVKRETIPQFSSFQEAANAVNHKYEEVYHTLLDAGIETESAVRENVEDRYYNLRKAGFELEGDEFVHYLADLHAFLKAYTHALEANPEIKTSPERTQYLVRIGREFYRTIENVVQSIHREESQQITQTSSGEHSIPYKTALTYLKGFQERLRKMLTMLDEKFENGE